MSKQVDARNIGVWRKCITTKVLDMPPGWLDRAGVALNAETGSEVSNNHDVVSLEVSLMARVLAICVSVYYGARTNARGFEYLTCHILLLSRYFGENMKKLTSLRLISIWETAMTKGVEPLEARQHVSEGRKSLPAWMNPGTQLFIVLKIPLNPSGFRQRWLNAEWFSGLFNV